MTGITKAAWVLLTALSALWALNHAVGAFVFAGDDIRPELFVLIALLGVVATIVLVGPYRERRLWAWWVVTAEVVALISVALITQPRVGVWYLTIGLLMAVAQLGTLREFRRDRAEQVT
ncbi:hypothetical protein [Jiangella asiatica]|uniref:DUF2568 domain-containing protein n=1 Tax=Jiangella asiatica TaxID=2530372 RepID=A0A4V2Z119_9ACTN|nr:hypothetical protein [Jiangella asiatica]TDE03078.1 hypothetical protein E1269_20685 [Jiangella asiatica]